MPVNSSAPVRVVAWWSDRADQLAARFWPGPLTLVLPRSDAVPDGATAGLPTIAVRCPAHDVAQRLLGAFDGPISAPSANRSGHVSPTNARHVAEDFGDAGDLLILDGGPCLVGIESTVVDLTTSRVLRPGSEYLVAVSHRTFPTKCIAIFRSLPPHERPGIVARYAELAGGFEPAVRLDRSPPATAGVFADPLWIVALKRSA